MLTNGTDEWRTARVVRDFRAITQEVPKPILVFSDFSYEATFVVLSHFADSSSSQTSPRLTSEDVLRVGSEMGFDFYRDTTLKQVLSEVTGEDMSAAVLPETWSVIPEWYRTYWLVKHVYGNWYVSGQIQRHHLAAIGTMRFESWINSRKGKTTPPDTPSQEEVTLLNIRDRTGTYNNGGRQTESRLLATRLDVNKSTEYISATSEVNYESRNPGEFGDDIGYNEEIQREAIRQSLPEIQYVHLPIGIFLFLYSLYTIAE